MATTAQTSTTTLQISRTFKANREKVFKAWTTPEALKQWFGPTDGFTVPSAEIDLRVGGKYRIQMKAPDGEVHTVGGVYREVSVPEKLIFTWAWEEGGGCGDSANEPPVETLVTVEFRKKGPSTEVFLTHELFPNSESKDKHDAGWSGCLTRLAKVL